MWDTTLTNALTTLMNWYEQTIINDLINSQNKQDNDVLLSGVRGLLNSKDDQGNTLLHIAVSQNQLQASSLYS